jgi:hypothetical protein
MDEEEKIESKLKGNTLRVYWMLLQSQSATKGVRAPLLLQRDEALS